MNDIFVVILKYLSYPFIQKALITGIFISISFSLLGSFLVLKKLSLISDGLSHVTFAAIAFSLLIGATPLLFSIPIVIIASFLIIKLTEKAYIFQDSAIGLVSASSIAIGVIIISNSKGFNLDIYSYLFGSILAISSLEIILSVTISIIIILIILLFINELFAVTYDQDFAKINKVNVDLLNNIFIILTSVTIVIGVKIVGALLVSSLIIFPAISSLQISKKFSRMIFNSMIISLTSVVTGLIFSSIFNQPTGAVIVMMNLFFFVLLFTINKIYKIK